MSQTVGLIPSSEESLDHFKTTLVECSHRYHGYKSKYRSILTKKHKEALRELQNNKDIIIFKPDKRSGVVIMNKSDYINKIHSILNDCSKFQKSDSTKDNIEINEQRMVECLKRLKEQGTINETLYENLRPHGTTTPRLYGLPKIHKQGIPVRPILDMFNSPYHATAKWLAKLLIPVRKRLCIYSLKDSFDFIQRIENLNTSGKVMLSFDVASLFTNIPLIETVTFLCNYIENEHLNIGLSTRDLKELILRCTLSIEFRFNNTMYKQIDGVAMGSPLGPILADIFMSMLETKVLNQHIEKLDFYCRYVDDIFILCDNRTDINKLLKIFNDAHHLVKFTMESESNQTLPFLDVLLVKMFDELYKHGDYKFHPQSSK